MSWLCVFMRVTKDGVSMCAEDGMIDCIWSVLIWIGMAVEPKPVRALHEGLVWLLKIRPRV